MMHYSSNCKSCNHKSLWHSDINNPASTLCIYFPSGDIKNKCGCKYIPSNNLEYLEYCYEKGKK